MIQLRKILVNQPISRQLSIIVATFITIITCLFVLSYGGLSVLSGVRAIVGGEGLWSKSQKDAIYHLRRYARTRDEAEYNRYRQCLQIPLGDHRARLGLISQPPRYPDIYAGFIEGGNHPDDVRIMTAIFVRLHQLSYIRKATRIWTEADSRLMDLQEVGDVLHGKLSSGKILDGEVARLLAKMDAINGELTPLENEFSYTLGEAARWVRGVFLAIMAAATLIMLGLGLYVVVSIARHMTSEIGHLRDAAIRVAAGDFGRPVVVESSDEIGELAEAFRQMAAQRREAEKALAERARELDESNKKLVEAERVKDEFFAKVSHELRTPLTLILAPLESLMSKDFAKMPAPQQSALTTVHNNAVRMLQMVTGLLDFSKLEAGKVEVKREPTDIVALTRAIFSDFEPLWKEKGLKGRFSAAAAPPAVDIDRYLYERIVFNLLSNASKFTPAGGEIAANLSWKADRLRLSVKDTGIGIAPEDLAKLFQKFQQLEAASTRRFEGTGLGLALAQEFAGLLAGSVSVASKPGQGSEFTVECLAAEAPPADKAFSIRPARLKHAHYEPSARPPDSPAHDASLPRVLVAEDNEELSRYIAGLLDGICRVTIARDGEEALEYASMETPDAILTDVMMPKLDGLQLCKALKSNSKTTAIPIVMLTAVTHRDALMKGWDAGADEYLYKPFHPKELQTRIASILLIRRQRKAAEDAALRLEQLKLEIKQRRAIDTMKDDFISTVSHELRTPLAIVRGAIENLRDGITGPLKPSQRQAVLLADRNTERLSRMINNLLELSRLESGRAKISPTPVNPSDLLEEAAEGFKMIAQKQKITFEKTIKGTMPAVIGDSDMILRLITNLLDNAFRFARSRVELDVRFDGSNVVFTIGDDGKGIPRDKVDGLFNKFVQVNRVSGAGYKGTGLGLAICKEIVDLHSGRIWVESGNGSGTRFKFQLPVAAPVNSGRLS